MHLVSDGLILFIVYIIDPRFPADHKVTLHFGDNNQTNDNRVLYFQSPLVKLEPLNPVTKYDSLEHVGNGTYILRFPILLMKRWKDGIYLGGFI